VKHPNRRARLWVFQTTSAGGLLNKVSMPVWGPLYLVISRNSVGHDPRIDLTIWCDEPRGWLRCECEHGAMFWKPIRCRRCPGCQQNKHRKAVAKIVVGTKGEEWLSLLTLTTRPGTEWSSIMGAWSSLVRKLRALYGRVEYAVAKEEGSSNGMRHLHAIIAGPPWISFVRVQAIWQSLLGAHGVNIKRITSGTVAGYVAKYVSKGQLLLPKLLTFSRGWKRSLVPPLVAWHSVCGEPVKRAWRLVTPCATLVEYWGLGGPCRCVPSPET